MQKFASTTSIVGCDTAKTTGVYYIRTSSPLNSTSFYAYCVKTPTSLPEDHPGKNGAWTTILYRSNSNINFYRNWEMYKMGFGNIAGDHWIGLKNLNEVKVLVSFKSIVFNCDPHDYNGPYFCS